VSSPEPVRVITIDGKEHILPQGIDVEVKFSDSHGGHHPTAEQAVQTKAVKDAEAIIEAAISWRHEEFDMQHILDHRDELIRHLSIVTP
jgi:hypothetical protein